MPSVIDICNAALSHIGDDAMLSSLATPFESVQAKHCATFWPVARDALLELHEAGWAFATKRAELVEIPDGGTLRFPYAYTVPADCIKILAVLPADQRREGDSVEYEREARTDGSAVIRTVEPAVELKYVFRADDPAIYPALFVDAAGWLLASYLAGPVIKGAEGRKAAQECAGFALSLLARAKVSDANQRRGSREEHVAPWVAARGMGVSRG